MCCAVPLGNYITFVFEYRAHLHILICTLAYGGSSVVITHISP